MDLNGRVPSGPIAEKWEKCKDEMNLVAPTNKRKYRIIVVGSGLAGGSAAATLGELGYNVDCFCFQDSSRRAHSIAAQGGINAAKNYQNDGDSVYRLFYDTIKGGDFRSREANVFRLAQVSNGVIDQCVAMGVPFSREYGGFLANRSFGGVQVSRTFYARGQTGQQLLLGVYSALNRQVAAGSVRVHPRTEMQDLVVVNGHAKGIVTRNLLTGEIKSWAGDAVVLATGGYSPIFFLSTNALGNNVSATFRAYKRGAFFANPCFTQCHPTCLPASGDYQSKLTLMSEALRNDGRIWVSQKTNDDRPPYDIPEEERDYYLERMYPSFGNLTPRDIASRAAKKMCEEGRGVGPTGLGVYLDFSDAVERLGVGILRQRYGNLFDMYEKITGDIPTETPMRIFPAIHFTMGGLWVDYHLMSNVPGLFVLGEANYSDHGANRLGANSMMQALADGYFIAPYTIGDYLAGCSPGSVLADSQEFHNCEDDSRKKIHRLLSVKGKRTVRSFHRELGLLMWDKCGLARNREGLEEGLRRIPELREEFWENVMVPGEAESLNLELEKAGRVADFMEFAELVCRDALMRKESCGGHFREEHQTQSGEALRNDEKYSFVAAWEHNNDKPILHKEPLHFDEISPAVRTYN